MTCRSETDVVLRAREPTAPPRFLPEPADIAAIARLAQQFVAELVIPYEYAGERRQLAIFAGGWWDAPAG